MLFCADFRKSGLDLGWVLGGDFWTFFGGPAPPSGDPPGSRRHDPGGFQTALLRFQSQSRF